MTKRVHCYKLYRECPMKPVAVSLLRGTEWKEWKMASERRTEPLSGKAATGSACYSG
ncbi:MAG: hypothetical protein II994_03935 [Lachnospiraceae bacterium]|nr:hypothetical protein [Lachnospiraceae bacterium]